MIPHLQAIADTVQRWERAEDCTLSLLLIGISDGVGVRRSIDYWTRDGRRLVLGHGRKLRYCADDIAEVLPSAGLKEILISRFPVESSALSMWWIDTAGVKGHARVTPIGAPLAAAEGVPA